VIFWWSQSGGDRWVRSNGFHRLRPIVAWRPTGTRTMTHLVPDAVTPSPPSPPPNPMARGSSYSAALPPSKAGHPPPPLASVCSICVDLIGYFVLRIQNGCCFDCLWIVCRVSGCHQFGSFLWRSYQEMDQVLAGVWKFAFIYSFIIFFFISLGWVKLDLNDNFGDLGVWILQN
jgi:hypothetical protein